MRSAPTGSSRARPPTWAPATCATWFAATSRAPCRPRWKSSGRTGSSPARAPWPRRTTAPRAPTPSAARGIGRWSGNCCSAWTPRGPRRSRSRPRPPSSRWGFSVPQGQVHGEPIEGHLDGPLVLLACLGEQPRGLRVVTAGQVGEDEPLRTRLARHLGRLARRRVPRLQGTRLLVIREGGLVDEQIRVLRGAHQRGTRAGVALYDHPPSHTRLAPHLLGAPDAAVGQLHGLAPLQLAVERPWGDSECLHLLQVELPRTLLLLQHIAERVDAV